MLIMDEFVVLIDNEDNRIGLMEKMQAHLQGVLHRAFSVFVFNDNNEMLLQQRALSKYHSPGLWTNTCCSHPRDGESYLAAAQRRMMEEMGLQCDMEDKFNFIYKADVGQGLVEHELDHVFIGRTNQIPVINKEEVESWRYASMDEVRHDMKSHPELYTEWFKIAFDRVESYFSMMK